MDDIAKINQRLITTNEQLNTLIHQPDSNTFVKNEFITNLKLITKELLDLPNGKTPHLPPEIKQNVQKLINNLPNIRQVGELQAAAQAFKDALQDFGVAKPGKKPSMRVEKTDTDMRGR